MSHRPNHNVCTPNTAADSLALIAGIFETHFPGRELNFLRAVFSEVQQLYAGHFPGYQACDSAYHDFTHTYVVTAAVARILDGHLKSAAAPRLTARDFELAIATSLLHDTGYIKNTGDRNGTGAKYTLTHPGRSSAVAQVLLSKLAATPAEIETVQSAILFAGLEEDAAEPAITARSRFIGSVVGSGDLLGQMATPDYPDQLTNLYHEFREATVFFGVAGTGIASYRNANDLMRRTREFYQTHVQKLLIERWGRVHDLLRYHFADGRNQYLDAIEQNLDRIDQLTQH